MASIIRLKPDASPTTLSTADAMDALAAGSGVLLSEFDNSASGVRWPFGIFEASLDFAVNPTAGRTVNFYILPSIDGTNYPDSNVTAVQSAPAFELVVAAATTAQRLVSPPIPLPPCKFKVYVVNDADQAFSSDAAHLKVLPYTTEVAAA
jgi:hypothetical protein